jgi:hypothetical protein
VESGYFKLPESEYRSSPAVAQSDLKEFSRSPAHYISAKCEPQESTPALILGTLIHAAVLEPESEPQYHVKPEGMKFSTKEGIAWRDSRAKGFPIISTDDEKKIKGSAEAVKNHGTARGIFYSQEGINEICAFAQCSETGLWRKGRFDRKTTDNCGNVVIADLKSCDDARPQSFQRSVVDYGYDRQAAYYIDLCRQIEGLENDPVFIFIAVEKTPPHGIRCYVLPPEVIEHGRAKYKRELAAFKKCQESCEWPGYEEKIEVLNGRKWFLDGE